MSDRQVTRVGGGVVARSVTAEVTKATVYSRHFTALYGRGVVYGLRWYNVRRNFKSFLFWNFSLFF